MAESPGMDWPRYRVLCDRPDVCSRWMLEWTLAVLDAGPVAAALRRILETRPLPKPAGHFGPPATDMFVVDLDAALVDPAFAAVLRAADENRLAGVAGERGPAGLVAAWREFAGFVGRADAGTVPPAG